MNFFIYVFDKMSFVRVLFFLSLVQFIYTMPLARVNRHCRVGHLKKLQTIQPSESKFTLFIILISGILFLLILLGMIKGLIGLLCWSKVGTYGLDLLVELPRPLDQYQEKNLKYRKVVYDVAGWPVHPDTMQRTVRPLTKRAEFCLNLVFFLAYPIAACITLCGFCCCIKNYKSNSNVCYKHIDVVKVTEDGGQDEKQVDMYNEYDKEALDTQYVLDAMESCKNSMHQIRSCCPCHSKNMK